MKKHAILSMDVEDWYHLDYFSGKPIDKSKSMLDGFTNYIELLNKYGIKTTFFVLGELAEIAKEQILYADRSGHEIACHGLHHTLPLKMDIGIFEKEIIAAKETLSELIGKEVVGYRAPCYSIDNARHDIIKKIGFKYSSSKMDVPNHPLYGDLNLSDYSQPIKSVYYKDEFIEFALSTKSFLGKNIAISGGGWIRLFPWNSFMKPLISSSLKDADVYSLYIHPFEFSEKTMPRVEGTTFLTNIRARRGLGKVNNRVEQLINMLKENGFEFCTFGQLANAMIYQHTGN